MFTAHRLSCPTALTTTARALSAMLALLVLSAHAAAPDNDAELLAAEARDAAAREQRELQDRAEDLARQLEEARKLQALQDAYLERLTRELEAMQQQDAQGAPHAEKP